MYLTLKTEYPCCGKPCRLRSVPAVPRERFERHCEPCNTRWEISSRRLVIKGAQVNLLDWADRGLVRPW